jgi:hypothetical protein
MTSTIDRSNDLDVCHPMSAAGAPDARAERGRTLPARARGRRPALAVTALLLLAAGCGTARAADPPAAAAGHEQHTAVAAGTRIDPVEFRQDMRQLWEEHVTWTRLFIVSAIAGLPDLKPTEARLLQNQADIGAAITPFYGKKAGAALTDLLRQHILIAAELVLAAKAGDTQAVTRDSDQWYANARQIADFLAAANPAWSRSDLRAMMRVHLNQTLAEATARLKGNWTADIADYDQIELHILAMADTLSAGIIEQFPGRFGS